MTKSEIESILKQKDIPYCIDVSNNNDKYTRNRYRKYILPELKKENKNVHKKFIEFNKTLLLANDYLEKISDKLYTECTINNEIDVKKFNKLDDIIKIYIIEKYLKDIYKEDIILLDNNHKNIILNNILNSTNIIFDLPCNKKGIVEYNRFKIIEINYIKYDIKFTDYVKLPNGKVIMIDNKTDLTTNFVIHLS